AARTSTATNTATGAKNLLAPINRLLAVCTSASFRQASVQSLNDRRTAQNHRGEDTSVSRG
ncbi:MAG TPA: hypothetical protein VF660_08395, partial [Actinomycetota bacterium]